MKAIKHMHKVNKSSERRHYVVLTKLNYACKGFYSTSSVVDNVQINTSVAFILALLLPKTVVRRFSPQSVLTTLG